MREGAEKRRSKGIPHQGWGSAGVGPGTQWALSIQFITQGSSGVREGEDEGWGYSWILSVRAEERKHRVKRREGLSPILVTSAPRGKTGSWVVGAERCLE